jgi:TolA-binding protein
MRPCPPAGLWISWLLAVLCALAPAASPAAPTTAASTQLGTADRQFAAKSYAAALEGYRAVLASGIDLGARRPEIEYHYTQCLSRSGRWDEPIREAERFARRYPGTIWEARGQYWLARLLLGSPSWGYEVDGRVIRGNELLWSKDARRARYVRLDQEDEPRILHALEAARTAFDRLRRTARTGAPNERQGPGGPSSRLPSSRSPRLTPEEVNLNFDLALRVQGQPLAAWAAQSGRAAPGDVSWLIDLGSDYHPEWPAPKRVLFLLRQIQAQGQPHQTAVARLAEARFADRYHAVLKQAARTPASQLAPPTPPPYQTLDAGHLLSSILADFPNDPIAGRVHYAEGLRLARAGDLNAALAVFRELARMRPHSPWAVDARAQIAGILRRELSLDTADSQPSGRPAHLTLGTRNVTRVDLRAYGFRPEEFLRDGVSQRYPPSLTNLAGSSSDPASASRLGPPIARWSITPRDRGDHRPVRATVTTPLVQPGAYLIVAETADLTARGLLLITDRVLIQKMDRDTVVCWVVDVRTGAPDPAARVYVREDVLAGAQGSRYQMIEGQTDRDGLFVFTRAHGSAGDGLDLDVVARSGSHYAVSPAMMNTWWLYNRQWDGLRAYSYTDRPIYRPGQVVHFRHFLIRRGGGRSTPLPNQAMQIIVKGPHANPVYQTTATTDAFGSLASEFTLAEEAELGEYSISLQPSGSQQWIPNDAQFRVEEYRKPEFEVTVTADQQAVRAGDPGRARVKALYYFGKPAAGARVLYRVYRYPWTAHYYFPDRLAFLYGYREPSDTPDSASGGELVRSGEARTDAAGEALISFPTGVSGSHWSSGSIRYTIEADVMDVSRRTVSGSGSVMATRQQFFAFLDTPQGFYVRGDRVPVEIVTQDVNARPVSAAGKLRVYRQTWNGGRREEALVHEEPFATDAAGRGRGEWVTAEGGAFRIAFETRDAWGAKVTGSLLTWVAGLGMRQYQPLRQGVQLVMADDVAREGGHVRALLVVDQPGATVLLTQEAGDQILRYEVLHLGGRMRIVDVPISLDHAPNFTLQAMMVRGGEVYQVTRQVRVPATRQLLNIRLTPDQEKYKPREPAAFRLLVTDWQGQPVRGVFSVGIVDASLYALQGEYTPDIRQFFYAEDRPVQVQTHASPWTQWTIDLKDRQPSPALRFQYWDRDHDVVQVGLWQDVHVADAWGFVENGPAWEMLSPWRWGYGAARSLGHGVSPAAGQSRRPAG